MSHAVVDIEHLRTRCLPRRKNLTALRMFWRSSFAGKDYANMNEVLAAFKDRKAELAAEGAAAGSVPAGAA